MQKQLFAGSLLIVMSGIASCTMAQSDRTSSQLAEATVSDAGETNAADVQDSETSTTAKLTLLEALAIAEGAVGDTKVYAMEQEIEDNKPVVEVELGDYEVLVHAETGEIVLLENLRENGDPEDLEEINEAAELVQFAAITIQEALEAAEASAGGNAHTVELDNEEGNLVYEVTVGRDVIYVDAGNGDVLSTIVIGQGGDSEESEWQSSVQVPYDESDSEEDD
ncbi:MAG TPA: PepSY domain-containing protein [Elainellaceae cyanobacterium]